METGTFTAEIGAEMDVAQLFRPSLFLNQKTSLFQGWVATMHRQSYELGVPGSSN